LKPETCDTGHVDGAWWPRSYELSTELPGLVDGLSPRLGAVERVVYGLDGWTKTPVRFEVMGRTVRLDGYRFQPAHTLRLVGVDRRNIVLLVIPPDTDPSDAHLTMMIAAAATDTSTADALLGVGHRGVERRAAAQRAQQRWDCDGQGLELGH
jgi:hypothetical protein